MHADKAGWCETTDARPNTICSVFNEFTNTHVVGAFGLFASTGHTGAFDREGPRQAKSRALNSRRPPPLQHMVSLQRTVSTAGSTSSTSSPSVASPATSLHASSPSVGKVKKEKEKKVLERKASRRSSYASPKVVDEEAEKLERETRDLMKKMKLVDSSSKLKPGEKDWKKFWQDQGNQWVNKVVSAPAKS